MNRDRLIQFASELVQLPSVLGNEGPCAERVAEEMRALGYDHAEVDEVGNAVGTIEGEAGPGPAVLYDGHLDTVDVQPRDAWARDPWSGAIEGDRIWGRGSSDMKGAVAAMVHGAAAIPRGELHGSLHVSASVSEEQIEGAALRPVIERLRPSYVVIGEASELRLVHGGRGRAELKLHARGVPSHASAPHLGRNAVLEMQKIHAQLEAAELPVHEAMGPGILCLTDIISDPYPAHSVVPSGCTSTWERRLVAGDTQEGVLADMRSAIEAAGVEADVTLARAQLETYTGHTFDEPKWYPPWLFELDEPFVRAACAALEEVGLEPSPSCYQFCTNGAYSAGWAGIPTLGFGPSDEKLAHTTDEYLEIEQLVGAAKGYEALGRALTLL